MIISSILIPFLPPPRSTSSSSSSPSSSSSSFLLRPLTSLLGHFGLLSGLGVRPTLNPEDGAVLFLDARTLHRGLGNGGKGGAGGGLSDAGGEKGMRDVLEKKEGEELRSGAVGVDTSSPGVSGIVRRASSRRRSILVIRYDFEGSPPIGKEAWIKRMPGMREGRK